MQGVPIPVGLGRGKDAASILLRCAGAEGTDGLRDTQSRRRNQGMAAASRRRAALFAEDAGSLPARRAAISHLSCRASWRAAIAESPRGSYARRCARLPGGAARRRHWQPLADAYAGRSARLRALPGAQRQGQDRGAGRGPGAENRQDPAAAACRHCRQTPGRPRSCGRRRTRAVDPRARRCRAGVALRQWLAHFRGAGPQSAPISAPAGAMPSR